MLLNKRCLKLLKLKPSSWRQHIIICAFLSNVGCPNPAWATPTSNTSEHHTLESQLDTLSNIPRLSASASDKTSFLHTSLNADAYGLLENRNHFLPHQYPALNDTHYQDDVLYLAAPENLNPGLYVPPPVAPEIEPITPELSAPETAAPETSNEQQTSAPFWDIDDLTVNLSDDFSNFGQGNRIIEPTFTGTLANGDQLSVTTGFNRYAQSDVDTVFNIPLKASWTGEMGDFTTTAGGGIDLFNGLPVALNLNASTSVPIGNAAALSFFVDHGPYKFNATTLNNQITAWRYGPNLFWQITPEMYLFSLARWGRYNDGNREQQSFSRLEHELGEFYVASNLFTWRYRENAESSSGYFSPPDFLVANAEIGWNGEVLDWLDCGANASWGRQRLNSSWSGAYSYSAKCTLDITESLEMDLGYSFSNVISQMGGSAFNNRAITSQVRAKF